MTRVRLVIALALLVVVPAAATTSAAGSLVDPRGVDAARRYALVRPGVVAFAVVDERGRLRGLRTTQAFASASVVKAMLLVAQLRRAGDAPLTRAQRAQLGPMIVRSSNRAARAAYAEVGPGGLAAVARAARMRDFAVAANLFDARITAADQARFFLRIDRLVPAAQRDYERELLAGIVARQRWGMPAAARRRGLSILFKGGWRRGLVHQVALLERGSRRVALAVLTSGQDKVQGAATIAAIARRVLRRASPSSA